MGARASFGGPSTVMLSPPNLSGGERRCGDDGAAELRWWWEVTTRMRGLGGGALRRTHEGDANVGGETIGTGIRGWPSSSAAAGPGETASPPSSAT